jgi:N utilization substance protein B
VTTDVRSSDPARGGRTRAREVVFRAVFEADLSRDDILEVLELSLGRFRFTSDGRLFAMDLTRGVAVHRERIDLLLNDLLKNWALERVSAVARAILRVAIAEMIAVPETPVLVILNEAVRLANRYGEDGAGGFVNGVLDAAARQVRPGALGEISGA